MSVLARLDPANNAVNWSGYGTHILAAQSFAVIVNPIPPCSGFKADVAPRGNPNGSVTISDWVEVGRFAAGLDAFADDCELARADCSPRPCGNGVVTVGDWVQAGRIAGGLDAPVLISDCPAGGGYVPAAASPQFVPASGSARLLSILPKAMERGRTGLRSHGLPASRPADMDVAGDTRGNLESGGIRRPETLAKDWHTDQSDRLFGVYRPGVPACAATILPRVETGI